MDLILYLLQFIQYQHKQICWLLNFICRYIPLKQWIFDDSHSPKYQKFKADQMPKIIYYEKWDYKDFIPYLEWKYSKKIKPVSWRFEYPLAAQQFFHEFGNKFKFEITQITGLTNDNEVSREFRPYKQMIEHLNRTYKASYRKTNGFDNIDGANYDLSLRVAYYNFLRPHKHNNYKVLNEVEMLSQADTMLGKWQLFIFLDQQTILNMQNAEGTNCSWIPSRR